MKKRFSIIHDMDEGQCYFCGSHINTHIHEIFYGMANRDKSIKYGLCVRLCFDHHTGTHGVHNGNRELDLQLKRIGQMAFRQKYPDLDFFEIFRRNYLDDRV